MYMTKGNMSNDYPYSEKCGFRFDYNNGKLNHSVLLNLEECVKIPMQKANEQNFYIFCKKCGVYMDFDEQGNLDDSKWICPVCGKKVKEMTAYSKIDKENYNF